LFLNGTDSLKITFNFTTFNFQQKTIALLGLCLAGTKRLVSAIVVGKKTFPL